MEGRFRVRKARLVDIPSLVRLMKDFYAEAHFELDEEEAAGSFSRLLSQPALGAVWIASGSEGDVGHVVLTVRHTMEHGGASGHIDDLFVESSHRRQGVASLLLRELERECLARGCKALLVEVGRDNPAGLRTYEKLQMKLVDDGRIIYRKALPGGHEAS